MNHELEQQLIDPQKQQPTQITPQSHSNNPAASHLQFNAHFVRLKLIVTITMATIFMLLRLFPFQEYEGCIQDLGHTWTMTLNWLIINDETFYQTVIIIAQQSIQINIIGLCIISTWKVKNLKVHMFLAIFYGVRAVFLNIQRFPYPQNIRWDAPWLPSFTVPYGITRDYFYSGHTGLMLFAALYWRELGYKRIFYVNLILTPVVILVLLASRVHYSIDIVAAAIFTFWLSANTSRKVVYFDMMWSSLFCLGNHLRSKVCRLLI